MRCSKCGTLDVKEIDSGETYDGGNDWITWHCLGCGHIWTTYSDYC